MPLDLLPTVLSELEARANTATRLSTGRFTGIHHYHGGQSAAVPKKVVSIAAIAPPSAACATHCRWVSGASELRRREAGQHADGRTGTVRVALECVGGACSQPCPTRGLLGSAIIAALPSLFASLPQEST